MSKNKMLAAVVYDKNNLKVEQVDIPETPKDSILVRVKACSICGTDLRIYTKGDYRAEYPVIIGHEIAGEIVDVSEGVNSFKVGERVCVAPGHGCGHCKMCKLGHPNVCENPHPSMGYKINGGFAEYIAVPKHILELGFVNRIPDNLSCRQASMAEIIACCINAQKNVKVNPRDTVLIMGAGPAGLIHAHLAKINGAKKVIVTQRSEERLINMKENFSDIVDVVIPSNKVDLFETVRMETDGFGPDVIFVCAPSRIAQEQALQLIRSRGRVNFFGGLPKEDCHVSLNSNDLHYKEFFVTGASSSLPETNVEALKLLSQRAIDPDRLISHVFPLSEIEEGFKVMQNKKSIKVVIEP